VSAAKKQKLLHPSASSNTRISKDGYSFDWTSDRWSLNKDINIAFKDEVLSLDNKTLNGFRLTLARYAEELSSTHTMNMYYHFQNLVRDTECKSLNVNTLLNWRASLGKEHEWYLGSLRGFLISWFDYNFHGVTADMVELLEGLTLSGNKKGVAVANRCPYSGAFTENELLALIDELINLWRSDEISCPCYTYINLLMMTARRTVQLRQLRACDITKVHVNDVYQYFLNIPRAKQRGVGFRGSFKKLEVTEELYLTLINLSATQEKMIERIFNALLDADSKRQVPLFLDKAMCKKLYSQGVLFSETIGSDVLHLSLKALRGLMGFFTRRQNAISERTGDVIHITARRFRHTRGSNLGRKGFGAIIVAEALDHSDIQNVKVYTESTADTVHYIDKAVGQQLAPFAQAFLGRVIENVNDGERGDDPSAQIPNAKNETMGACGTNDFCVNGFEACYVCRKFRPLLDAPHKDVLESLYNEKTETLKKTGSVQLASVKDRLIMAVEQIVNKCNQIKSLQDEV
jgi:integrase